MAVESNIGQFRRALVAAGAEFEDRVLEPLARYIGVRFGQVSINKYMRDAGFAGASERRSPKDSGPLYVRTTRLSSAVEGSFYQGRREGVTSIEITEGGFSWQRRITVPYARIHEKGGTITIPTTDRMRRYFWARFYETENERWKGLAFAAAQQSAFTVRIPARPYAAPAIEDIRPDVLTRGEMLILSVLDEFDDRNLSDFQLTTN